MNRSARIAVLILLVLAGTLWLWPRAGGDKDSVPPTAAGDARAAQRGNVLLAQIAAYEVPALAGFTERRDAALSPWVESRSHAVLAWLLAGPARNDSCWRGCT